MPEFLNPSDGPAQMERRLRDMERRLAALEASRRVQLSTIAGGKVQVVDDAGGVVAVIGQRNDLADAEGIEIFDPDKTGYIVATGKVQVTGSTGTVTDYGISSRNPDTDTLQFAVTAEHGVIRPVLQYEWRSPATPTAVTGASFASVYQSIPRWWPTTALRVDVAVGSDVGTTGEVRLKLNRSGTLHYSSAISIPDGASPDYRVFRWDLEGLGIDPIGATFFVDVEARRTGGAGNVNVYEPLPLASWVTDLSGADVDGVV